MNNKRFMYIFLAVILITGPLLISIYVDIPNLDFNLSIYGIIIFIYMIIQMIFAFLNRMDMNKICEQLKEPQSIYNILIVGYREQEELFRKCLKSHKKHLFNPNINRIIVVVDGDEEEDLYMADIFKEVFSYNGKVYRGGYPSSLETKAICILQRHRGKRHVLYTGLQMSCDEMVEGVICTDSDTEMGKYSVEYLIQTLESSSKIGAVTGMMFISNTVSIISFMSYIRYWFACNLERAYQSYNGIVLCVSGPVGIYRTSVISKFLMKFVNQTFMGRECTYGDDRHLTNNVLEEGYQVKFNHLVTCYTDTPENVFRFFNQQTRWCKSSYREILWTLCHIHKHSFWMTIDIVYQTAYSLIVLSSLIYIMILRNIEVVLYYFLIIILMNVLKGLYAVILEKNTVYLLYSLYGFIYITLIIPSKIYAGLTLSDTSWGTSSRKNIFDKINYGHLFMILWVSTLFSIILYDIIMLPKTMNSIIVMSFVLGYTSISFVVIKFKSIFM